MDAKSGFMVASVTEHRDKRSLWMPTMVWGMLEKVRQRAIRLVARLIQSLRVLAYRAVSSNHLEGSPSRYQPILCLGAGRISVDEEVVIGVPASPGFFSTYAYLRLGILPPPSLSAPVPG